METLLSSPNYNLSLQGFKTSPLLFQKIKKASQCSKKFLPIPPNKFNLFFHFSNKNLGATFQWSAPWWAPLQFKQYRSKQFMSSFKWHKG